MATQMATITMEGISPLLMHAFPLTPVKSIEKKSPAEQAEISAYRDPDTNELYVPGVAVQRCLSVQRRTPRARAERRSRSPLPPVSLSRPSASAWV